MSLLHTTPPRHSPGSLLSFIHVTPQVRNIECASVLYNAFATIPMIALMTYATISLNGRSEEIGEQSVRLLASSGLAGNEHAGNEHANNEHASPELASNEHAGNEHAGNKHAGNEHSGNEPGSDKAGGDGASDLEACTTGGGGDAAAMRRCGRRCTRPTRSSSPRSLRRGRATCCLRGGGWR